MKILFPFIGDTIGGSHISSLVLIRELENRGHEALIVVHKLGALTEYFDECGVVYRCLSLRYILSSTPKTPRALGEAIWGVCETYRALVKIAPDIIHTNDARSHLTWCIAAKGSRVPWVCHQRTPIGSSRLTRALIHGATRVIAISEFVVSSLPKRTKARTAVISNPVEIYHADRAKIKERRDEILNRAEVSSHGVVVGVFGNLRKVKDPVVAIEAFVILQSQLREKSILVVFGEDREGYRVLMEKIARKANVQSRVLFMGFQTPIIDWIAACDLILAPSREDAFGRTLIEAMSVGTVVVATDAGGHPEIIDHRKTGMLAPIGQADKFAQAAIEVLTNQALKNEIIGKGKVKADTAFSVRKHVDHVVNVYGSITTRS